MLPPFDELEEELELLVLELDEELLAPLDELDEEVFEEELELLVLEFDEELLAPLLEVELLEEELLLDPSDGNSSVQAWIPSNNVSEKTLIMTV